MRYMDKYTQLADDIVDFVVMDAIKNRKFEGKFNVKEVVADKLRKEFQNEPIKVNQLINEFEDAIIIDNKSKTIWKLKDKKLTISAGKLAEKKLIRMMELILNANLSKTEK